MSETKIPHLVIIGSGFAGMYTLKQLRKILPDEKLDITVVSKTDHFLFTPLLIGVATGKMSPARTHENLIETFGSYMDNFLQTTATAIDLENKVVKTEIKELSYDYLLIATGSKPNFHNVAGADVHTHTIKTLAGGLKLKQHLKQLFSDLNQENVTDDDYRKHFVIVGAGPAGVDMAMELNHYLQSFADKYPELNLDKYGKVTLVEAAATPLPLLSNKIQTYVANFLTKQGIDLKTSSKVSEVTEHKVVLEDGSELPSATTIWLAGTMPNHPHFEQTVEYNEQGCLRVSNKFQLEGFENVFVAGDASCIHDPKTGKPYPMLAQVAMKQSYALAKVLKHYALGQPERAEPFRYISDGTVVPLGRFNGIAEVKGFLITGMPAWMIRKWIYFTRAQTWKERYHLIREWFVSQIFGRETDLNEAIQYP